MPYDPVRFRTGLDKGSTAYAADFANDYSLLFLLTASLVVGWSCEIVSTFRRAEFVGLRVAVHTIGCQGLVVPASFPWLQTLTPVSKRLYRQ
jgi:hypothetical protein